MVMAPPASVMSMKKKKFASADQPVPESTARPSTRIRLPSIRASSRVNVPLPPGAGTFVLSRSGVSKLPTGRPRAAATRGRITRANSQKLLIITRD